MTRYNPQWTQALSYSASVDRRLLSAIWPGPASVGVAVSPATAMTLNVAPGQVAVPTYNNSGSALCTSDAVEQVTLPAAPGSGLNRIDIVCCQLRVADVDASYPQNDFIFQVSSGAPAASPTPPGVPNNAVVLAQILVPGGSASVTAGNITDRRPHGIGPEPPLSVAAPFASYTDPNGEAWVAKGGVNGGAWRKARDVLHCQYSRTTGWTVPSPGFAAIPFDAPTLDAYGLYNPATGVFTAPLAGQWLITVLATCAAAASGSWLQAELTDAASNAVIVNTAHAAIALTLQVQAVFQRGIASGGTMTPRFAGSSAMSGSFGTQYMRTTMSYLGTG